MIDVGGTVREGVNDPTIAGMEPIGTIAIGIDLDFVPTAAGGRRTPLPGGRAPSTRFTYRPNWGLPGWADGVQTAGPILGFSRTGIRPGESARAIFVPLFVAEYPEWRGIKEADVLRLYEGSRVCAHGRVAWVVPATWPTPETEQAELLRWFEPDAKDT
ncbi:hypothetical protein GCM10009725_13270 [Aeromicrobium tamlense]